MSDSSGAAGGGIIAFFVGAILFVALLMKTGVFYALIGLILLIPLTLIGIFFLNLITSTHQYKKEELQKLVKMGLTDEQIAQYYKEKREREDRAWKAQKKASARKKERMKATREAKRKKKQR